MRSLFGGLTCILVAVGIQMVHSASLSSGSNHSDVSFLSRHLSYLALAGCCAWFAARIPPGLLEQNARLLFWAFVAILVCVLIPGIGTRVNGAQRWLRFAGLSLQPSELGRIVMPIVGAALICETRRSTGFRLAALPVLLLPVIVCLPLVAVEPDLGATVFLGMGYVIALFLGGWPVRYFAAAAAIVIPAGMSLLILRPYQMQRITGFIAAWQDLSRAPWQIRQSLLSLGSGGLDGVGIGNGWQKLSYLPEANTDFVFAVIGEELGLVGTVTICCVWWTLYLTGRASLQCLPRRSFRWIVGNTLLLQLVIQAMANVAVVTAMVPPKGVPHPFISYGGTNLLVSVVSVGLIIGLSRSACDLDDTAVSEQAGEVRSLPV
ncbi:MAG: cell division protein FtsW [Planctomycetaceae bacterium]|nr:cell division protein FtsW [Planctomycetaceae bacterium]